MPLPAGNHHHRAVLDHFRRHEAGAVVADQHIPGAREVEAKRQRGPQIRRSPLMGASTAPGAAWNRLPRAAAASFEPQTPTGFRRKQRQCATVDKPVRGEGTTLLACADCLRGIVSAMPTRSSKPRDANQAAKHILDQLTGDEPREPAPAPPPAKNPAAVALGRLGGKKGGAARAAALSPRKRKEIAKKAAAARWSKLPDNT